MSAEQQGYAQRAKEWWQGKSLAEKGKVVAATLATAAVLLETERRSRVMRDRVMPLVRSTASDLNTRVGPIVRDGLRELKNSVETEIVSFVQEKRQELKDWRTKRAAQAQPTPA